MNTPRRPPSPKPAQPVGDCFVAAAELLIARTQADPAFRGEVVHGLVTGSPGTAIEGLRYSHAWVEVPGPVAGLATVLDHANGRELSLPAPLYYALGRIEADELQRYDYRTLLARMRRHRHYGPWDGQPARHRDPEIAA